MPLEKVGHVKTTLPQMVRVFFIKEPLLLKAGLGPVSLSLVQKQQVNEKQIYQFQPSPFGCHIHFFFKYSIFPV